MVRTPLAPEPRPRYRSSSGPANWLCAEAHYLYQASLVHRYLGRIRFGKHVIFDDDVPALQRHPLGMFLYNQRALVFGAGAVFLLSFAATLIFFGAHRQAGTDWLTLAAIGGAWLAGVVTTLSLHANFKQRLHHASNMAVTHDLPPMFTRYFLIDSFTVFCLFVLGKAAHLPLDGFLFLLLANTIVYAAYVRSGYRHSLAISATIVALVLAAVAIGIFGPHKDWFYEHVWTYPVFIVAPFLGMLLITLFSIAMISWLRTLEQQVTCRHIELLGDFAQLLSGPRERDRLTLGNSTELQHYDAKQYRRRLTEVLRTLCSLGPPFWYSAACVWFQEEHHDHGTLLLPGPCHSFPLAREYSRGIAAADVLMTDRVLLISATRQEPRDLASTWLFNLPHDAPAAVVPLRREHVCLGFLTLYGRPGGPSVQRHEEAFLSSLGEIIVNTIEQWEGRFHALSRQAMDGLFSCESLAEVFPKAARILQEFLFARGCMIIFRAYPDAAEMRVVAAAGFSKLEGATYRAGQGQTGKCAATRQIIRFDDVAMHREEFDAKLLRRLEKAHGRPITSWMAIPIGNAKSKNNYGVVKVVNSRFRCEWFTNHDVSLGEDLALRLHVIIERFLHLQHTEEIKKEALRSAAAAEQSRAKAEDTARQRQQDLMNITHQIQGALIAVIGSLSGIRRPELAPDTRRSIDDAQALVEDGLAIGYGVTTALAREAGRETAFASNEINAPVELKKLCLRLQWTNAREDLVFTFKEEANFPKLRMDRNVFTSVLFSLIHNAMKYADENSEVTLECSSERNTGEAALKVKSTGEPIDPAEKERVFEKFYRGRSVERGRHHGGVGLGLWVARELMRASGGDLTVELTPKDPRFSIFIVHVPERPAEEERANVA